MNDKPWVVVGLIIALAILTVPFWYTLAAGQAGPRPELELPEGGQCVRDTEYMRASHMDLLNHWRDEVVRQGDTTPVEVNGRQFRKSLTECCLQCHTSRQNFCKRCHDYANVRPPCWDCHVAPEGT